MPIMSRLSFIIYSALVPRARAERSYYALGKVGNLQSVNCANQESDFE